MILTLLLTMQLLVASPEQIEVYNQDKNITPGATLEVSKEELCKVGYTSKVRHVSLGVSKRVFHNYSIPFSERSKYEVDHLISLELGGSNEIKNLWPQFYCPKETAKITCFGAREKDVVETNLHRRICRGEITIQEAQKIITEDWYAEYKKIKGVEIGHE